MKALSFFILTLTFYNANSQQLNTNYRTAREQNHRIHLLIFTDSVSCKLTFPATTHGELMMQATYVFNMNYRSVNDTITFYNLQPDSDNIATDRLLEAKFISSKGQSLYDCRSGYTYVPEKNVPDKHIIYSLKGKIYKQKATKIDSYGLIRKEHKMNRRLKRELNKVNIKNYSINLLSGKDAYDKYGLIGINGVFEIERK